MLHLAHSCADCHSSQPGRSSLYSVGTDAGSAAGRLHIQPAETADLRKQARRNRYDGLSAWDRKPPTPEELHAAAEEQNKVRAVLGALSPRQAELLLLRSQGLNYDELASTLDLNPASVGTLLSRAQQAFRKEYVEKYGKE